MFAVGIDEPWSMRISAVGGFARLFGVVWGEVDGFAPLNSWVLAALYLVFGDAILLPRWNNEGEVLEEVNG